MVNYKLNRLHLKVLRSRTIGLILYKAIDKLVIHLRDLSWDEYYNENGEVAHIAFISSEQRINAEDHHYESHIEENTVVEEAEPNYTLLEEVPQSEQNSHMINDQISHEIPQLESG